MICAKSIYNKITFSLRLLRTVGPIYFCVLSIHLWRTEKNMIDEITRKLRQNSQVNLEGKFTLVVNS